ncbi:MAG: GDSL-type esterase/lipase family protein [Flavobacteriales bacterium]|jgi:lysophospholipase L1-like esterase
MMTPVRVFLYIAGMLALLVLAMIVIPKEGINLFGHQLKFKTIESLWEKDSVIIPIDVEKLLAERDSLASAKEKADSISVTRSEGITSIQFKDQNSSSLFGFFEALESASSDGPIHILHYGDSQIEGDRMTGLLRTRLQSQFGGRGTGLISPVPLVSNSSISQTWSSNWKRFTAYGYEDMKTTHNRFGVMGAYGKFISEGADTTTAWLELTPRNGNSFSRIVFYLANVAASTDIQLLVEDSIIAETTIIASSDPIRESLSLGSAVGKKVKIVFKSTISPDVHALSLESGGGVYADNIAWRGSSGTIFKKMDSRDLRSEMQWLNSRLIILQFGGNTVPSLTSAQGAKDYGSYFRSQIAHVKQLCPEASIIVIGPSDMSTSVDGNYQTWPYLEAVRDAMKEAAFAQGCGFWDMYEVMGGRNSMVSWVNSNPPYAGPDYTHFTPGGAKRVADLFFKSLMKEFDAWKSARA